MSTHSKQSVHQKWSWIFYDFANSAFATTVIAGFFPVFFKKFWSAEMDSEVTTSRLGLSLGIAGVMMAVLSPIWGRRSDLASSRKKWLLSFAFMGMFFTGALTFIPKGEWMWALIIYVLAYIAFEASLVFYDSLLTEVCAKKDFEKVSSQGFALGYLGGGLLFALNVIMTLKPELFGLESSAQAVQYSFLTVAVWWLLFSTPLIFFLKEKVFQKTREKESWFAAFPELLSSFKKLFRQKPIFFFLLAYWFYIDGVYTVYTMAVDFGLSIGLQDTDLMKALLITQFVGFPSALLFGKLSDRFGVKPLLLFCLAVYTAVLAFSMTLDSGTDFMILAAFVGFVQGGIQALSRSFYARLIPEEQAAEYFGFFNIIGKSASFVGPFLIAVVTYLTHNHRLSLFSITFLFILGAVFLMKSDMKKRT